MSVIKQPRCEACDTEETPLSTAIPTHIEYMTFLQLNIDWCPDWSRSLGRGETQLTVSHCFTVPVPFWPKGLPLHEPCSITPGSLHWTCPHRKTINFGFALNCYVFLTSQTSSCGHGDTSCCFQKRHHGWTICMKEEHLWQNIFVKKRSTQLERTSSLLVKVENSIWLSRIVTYCTVGLGCSC